ncbi:MAG: Crp/Fnr family transcriptional regulator [Gemmatimonadaceae bacterium]
MTTPLHRDLSPRAHSPAASGFWTAPEVEAALRPIAEHVAPPLLALARAAASVIRLSTGERLFAAGDAVPGLHLIAEGAIRVIRTTPDRGVVIHRELAGGVLGEVALFSDGRYPGTAVAMEPTLVILLSETMVLAAIQQNPELSVLLLRRLASRTRDVIGRLDRIANLTVMRRLALHLLDRAASGRAGGATVSLGMTQVQLAEELGTVKEIITRELRALGKQGLIVPQGAGRYAIRDRDGLHRLAGRGRQRSP